MHGTPFESGVPLPGTHSVYLYSRVSLFSSVHIDTWAGTITVGNTDNVLNILLEFWLLPYSASTQWHSVMVWLGAMSRNPPNPMYQQHTNESRRR